MKVFYGDASRLDLLNAAGASKAKMLIVAVDEEETGYEIIKNAQKYYPHLKILVRSRNWANSYKIMDLGIDQFYREYLDSALRLGADALKFLGFRQYQIHRSAKTFRKQDEMLVRKLYQVRDQKREMLQSSKNLIENIVQVLKEDNRRIGKDKNEGWNTEQMKKDFKQVMTKLEEREKREEKKDRDNA
ncbi:NAD-binding protein [Persicobacter diffluens]|uniref:RCK N-terminal domain-containing protein n=1 Tax=Persicobacter diffluens TaxID=981 RepID=A0AAN5AL34_9BACT|nr:hypothetical protein PEDI_40270 [Persicobacter diffluens]